MNGAIAELCANTRRIPKATIMKTSGNSQNFFLTRRKDQTSLMMDM
jgi:hypothetical protein